METNMKAGHPVLGIVLGIVGFLISLPITLIFGVGGGAVAFLLGLIALLLGISAKRKGGKGGGAIVMGTLAILIAVSMTLFSISTFRTLHDEAERKWPGSLIAKYCDNPYFGAAGILSKMPKDEGGLQELKDELEELGLLDLNAAETE